MPIHIKRAYDEPEQGDGYRILVDRLWPRGVSKEDLQVDEWMKNLAPSDELRKWFDHEPQKFDEFEKKYRKELNDKSDLIEKLLDKAQEQTVTLIYAAKDRDHNNAVVLRGYLNEKSR